jgi:AcrR family transcriptional regulator
LYNVVYHAQVSEETQGTDSARRRAVLEAALEKFAQAGYRPTSMDAVARAAGISRPGLYFLFESKESLFREAAKHVITQDLATIEQILEDEQRPLGTRLLQAFDQWAGRYVGPMAKDVSAVVADNPDLLDPATKAAPARFDAMVTSAIAEHSERAKEITQTLNSVSVGLKHQVTSREAYLKRFRVAIDLLVP